MKRLRSDRVAVSLTQQAANIFLLPPLFKGVEKLVNGSRNEPQMTMQAGEWSNSASVISETEQRKINQDGGK